jgi:uncharacterized protein YfaP (DUF2135 family)
LLAALPALSVTSCLDGQQADPGTDLGLRVGGGVMYRGALPGKNGGPDVQAAYLTQTHFAAGYQNKSFTGVLAPNATSAAIQLEGDSGYWIVVAGPPLPESPDSVSFDAPLSFSGDVAPGPHRLFVAAVDAKGRFGKRAVEPFTLTAQPLPRGTLVISLFWDTEADLDLHVVLPDGVEIYRERPNSWSPPRGVEPDANAYMTGGRLDFDSNAQCHVDGRRNENVYFTTTPPSGRYLVRVDTFSLCGASSARFSVEATFGGRSVASAGGQSLPDDTRFSHGEGAGVTVFELHVP